VDERPQRFLDITALLLTICALLVVWTTVRLAGPGQQWDAAMVAVAPVLILHAFTNWDLIAVACTGLALYAWARGRVGWAGVAVGIGVATKLYPLLLLVALLPLCLRARRLREWGIAAGAATFAWAVVDLPVWVAYPAAFGRFYSGNRLRPADWDSLWFALQHLIGHPLDSGAGVPNVLNIAVAATFVAGLAFVGWLTLAAPRRPRVAQVAFLVVLTFLLANKVFSPQYSLWLLPLAVLARPRWGMFLLWQASEVFLLFTRFYFFVGVDHSGQGLPAVVFLCAVLARDAVLVTLAWLVAREMWHPERDVVRRHAVDDPAGGPVEGAADTRFGLPWRALSRDGSAG
jgi:uncharacterized membrane protein